MALPAGLAGLSAEQIRSLSAAQTAGTLPSPGLTAGGTPAALVPTGMPTRTTNIVAGGVRGASTLPDFGGSQFENAQRAGLLLGGKPNPFFQHGIPSANNPNPTAANPGFQGIAGLQQRFQTAPSPVAQTNVRPVAPGAIPPTLPAGRPFAPGEINSAGARPSQSLTGGAFANIPGQTPESLQNMQQNDPEAFATFVRRNPGFFGGTVGGIQTGAPGEAPPTGLIGAEQALLQSLQGGTGAINLAADQGRGDIQTGLEGAQGQLTQAGEDVSGLFGEARGGFDPFAEQGRGALQIQAALSGALGQEAFDQALIDSPAQAFLRERGERAVTRNAAALGGLGGGNVQKELARFGQGLASTDLQNQIGNLQGLSQLGLSAQGDIGNLFSQQAQLGAALGQAGAGFQQQAGANLANIAVGSGRDVAQGIFGTGQQIATGRTDAGNAIASAIGSATSGLSSLVGQQGAGLADIVGIGGSNLANILAGLGGQTAQGQQQLAALLANVSQGQAGQVAGLPGLGGLIQPGTALQDLGTLAGGLGGLFSGLNTNPTTTTATQAPISVAPTAATINTGQQFGGFA